MVQSECVESKLFESLLVFTIGEKICVVGWLIQVL